MKHSAGTWIAIIIGIIFTHWHLRLFAALDLPIWLDMICLFVMYFGLPLFYVFSGIGVWVAVFFDVLIRFINGS